MQIIDNDIYLSASDLVGHLNCVHLTELDLAVAKGVVKKPAFWDPLLDILRERGARHEREYIEQLRADGLSIVIIEGIGAHDQAIARTREAMEAGAEIIVQGAFRFGSWTGRTDVLRRIDRPSDLGPWSYEIIDTKLARETKGGTVLQLCVYAELVASVQGVRPANCYVVAPWTDFHPQAYRMDDYRAYFRRVRNGMLRSLALVDVDQVCPDPREHCEMCQWQERCDTRRRKDDHLSLIAGVTKLQIEEVKRQGVDTAWALAKMPVPLSWKPSRGAAASYERVREQARIQVEGREAGRLLHEFLPIAPGFGLTCLPPPSPGDIFFDLEGDPFVGEGGLEYLFGYSFTSADGSISYTADWVFTPYDEKRAFERFVDFAMARLKTHLELHIYHFAPYEPAALKRLMGRYATREEEIDFLLRSRRFVDLYRIVRGGLRVSTESYSIKKLEPLYGYSRSVTLPNANKALAKIQACLELGDLDLVHDADRDLVAGYNNDDCLSTLGLRDWLEDRRAWLVANGTDVPRPEMPPGEPSEGLSAWQERINALIARLTDGAARRHRADAGRARALAACPLSRLAPARAKGGLVGIFQAIGS